MKTRDQFNRVCWTWKHTELVRAKDRKEPLYVYFSFDFRLQEILSLHYTNISKSNRNVIYCCQEVACFSRVYGLDTRNYERILINNCVIWTNCQYLNPDWIFHWSHYLMLAAAEMSPFNLWFVWKTFNNGLCNILYIEVSCSLSKSVPQVTSVNHLYLQYFLN